jgi:hypothetical protein
MAKLSVKGSQYLLLVVLPNSEFLEYALKEKIPEMQWQNCQSKAHNIYS